MKDLIFMSLLSLIMSLNIPTIEFGKETSFSPSNNQFQFVNNESEQDYVLVYVSYDSYDLEYTQKIDTGNYISTTINEPGEGILFDLFNKGTVHTITLDYKEARSKKSGKLWVNPLLNELNVDLNQKYSFNIPLANYGGAYKEYISPLTFIITKSAKTVEFKFEYKENFECHFETMTVKNPFKICHIGDDLDCIEDISSYKFIEGESYKIYIKLQRIKIDEYSIYQVIPPFSFGDKNKSQLLKFKFWIIALAFLLI